MFNDPGIQEALGQADLGGALSNFQNLSNIQAPGSIFGGLGGAFNTSQGLGQLFGAQAALGPQDLTGIQNPLFSAGVSNQLLAGDQTALQNAELASLRAAAQPATDRLFNRLQDRLFATGQLGSTGGAEQLRGFFEAQNQQDLDFQNQAFGRALSRGQFLGNLGGQQIGLGTNILGQNLNQFNAGAGLARGFLGDAAGFEQQAFNQNLGALDFNRQGGLGRLNAAFSTLGFGNDLLGSQFGLGLQGAGFLAGQDEFALNALLGLRGAGNNQISAATGGSLGIANAPPSGFGSFLAGAGQTIGGLFNRPSTPSLSAAQDISNRGGT